MRSRSLIIIFVFVVILVGVGRERGAKFCRTDNSSFRRGGCSVPKGAGIRRTPTREVTGRGTEQARGGVPIGAVPRALYCARDRLWDYRFLPDLASDDCRWHCRKYRSHLHLAVCPC